MVLEVSPHLGKPPNLDNYESQNLTTKVFLGLFCKDGHIGIIAIEICMILCFASKFRALNMKQNTYN